MSTQAQKLNTAVRRYCIQRHRYWTEKYSELVTAGGDLSDYGYTREALQTFPRYNALKAILIEIERYDPVSFTTIDEAKYALSAAASNAQDVFTQPPNGPIEQDAMRYYRSGSLH